MDYGKKLWETGVRGKLWRIMKKMTECMCEKNAVMLDGEIAKCVDILQGVACVGVPYHLIYSRYIY